MAQPGIFVSHNTQDNEWCRTFVATLKAVGYDVWYDEQGLSGGTAWVNTIQNALQSREIFIVILTPEAWASRWVQDEIQLAYATQRTILPIRLKPTTIEGFLLTRQWIDAVGKEGPVIARQVVGLIESAVIIPPQAAPKQIVAVPEIVPGSLQRLGFVGQRIEGVDVILPPLCAIPAGPFLMGTDPQREPDHAENEERMRSVEVAAFAIAKFPVTVAEYAQAIKAGVLREPNQWEKQVQRPDHPVVMVSWRSALAYVAWLRDVTGQAWRLPTEDEWEKAARGSDGRIFPWGSQWDRTRANTEDGGPGDTTSVGSYPSGASPYGVLDMAGNVSEWCGLPPDSPQLRPDLYGESSPKSNGYLSGGSWNDSPTLARAAHRSQLFMGERTEDIGFRLVYQG